MLVILLCVTGLCVLAVIYPYVIYMRVLTRLPARPIARQEGHELRATLVFCAYNEEATVPEKLANIERLKAKHPDLEVLAFDDGSSDRTADILSARPDLLELVQGGGRNGKAHGMKLLASRATGDIIIFTDANVVLDEAAIDALMAWYADPEVGGICGSLHYLNDQNSVTANVGSRYWNMEEALKKEESRTGNVMGADGSIFSLRRALYPDFPDTVLDDLTVSMAAIFAGKRLIKVEDVIAYERLVANRQDEIARKIRIATRAFHTHLVLKPQLAKMGTLDKFKYGSRKMLRWFGGGFLVVGALTGLAAAVLISPVLALVGAVFVAGIGLVGMRHKTGPAASVVEIVIALIATQIGIFNAMRGQVQTVWNPAKSR